MGSVMLLAVTNHVTQNIASVPFLWVLPLSLYLVTFILAFDHPRWYIRPVFVAAVALLLPAMAWLIPSLDLQARRAALLRGALRRVHVLPRRARAAASPTRAT